MTHPVEIRCLPSQRLAALPHTGPHPEIGAAFTRLAEVFAARALWPEVRGIVAVYYDGPAAAALHSHAGHVVRENLELAPPLEEVRLPAGRYAVMTVVGPYSGLAAAYDQLYSIWQPASGEDLANAPVFEVYRNSPADTAPEDLITEVCLPLAPPKAR